MLDPAFAWQNFIIPTMDTHPMREKAKEIAAYILKNRERRFRIVSHIDADGITAATIASLSLDRLNIPHYVEFVKQLDDARIMEIRKAQGLDFYEVDAQKAKQNGTMCAAAYEDTLDDENLDENYEKIDKLIEGKAQSQKAKESRLEEGAPNNGEEIKKPITGAVEFDSSKVEREIIWFTDLGSGILHLLDGLEAIVTDHHVPSTLPIPEYKKSSNASEKQGSPKVPKEKRRDLLDFASAVCEGSDRPCEHAHAIGPESASPRVARLKNHLNPHLFGMNGAHAISGAGATYFVARALDERNRDLSSLAIVGAVGDLQDAEHTKLVGANEEILADGMSCGVISKKLDIRLFGRETRPLFKLLQYANDPVLPGITGSEDSSTAFLMGLGINLKLGENWVRWIDLSHDDKRKIISNLISLLLAKGFGHKTALRIIGEVYLLNKEFSGTELHDAKEYATLLNSCGRYERAEVGFRVCKGDRAEWYAQAKALLQGHRRTLVDMIQLVKELGIEKRTHLQYFHGKDMVLDNIVGIVAGMLLGSGELDRSVPLFGFAYASDGSGVKVSARGDHAMVQAGLDLSLVMQKSSESVGGTGGGHNVAAGAIIPHGKEEAFLEKAEEMIKEQLSKKKN